MDSGKNYDSLADSGVDIVLGVMACGNKLRVEGDTNPFRQGEGISLLRRSGGDSSGLLL